MQNLRNLFEILRSNNKKVNLAMLDGGRTGDSYILHVGNDFVGLSADADKVDFYPYTAIKCILEVERQFVYSELAKMPLRVS